MWVFTEKSLCVAIPGYNKKVKKKQQLICNLFQVDYGFVLQNEHVAVSFIKKLENY